MRHILRFQTESPLSAIQAALAKTRTSCVSLVFPLGEHPALADVGILQALRQYCVAQEIDAAIIGGDAAFRAAAVTCGFGVATSLDEWDLASSSSPGLPVSRLLTRIRASARDPEEQPVPLSIVRDRPGNDDDQESDHLYDPWSNNPPEYVTRLLAVDGYYTGPIDASTSGKRRAPVTRRLRDLDDEDLLQQASESFEEDITTTIRDTGGTADFQPDTPWPPDDDDFGDSSAP